MKPLSIHRSATLASAAIVLFAMSAGCRQDSRPPAHDQEHEHGAAHTHDHADGDAHDQEIGDGHDHEAEAEAPSSPDHIAIPPSVRQNLGITFVKVEERPVSTTKRLPGQFELRPKARAEYNVMLPGRVMLAVEQYQNVAAGDLLFELDSPEWRRVQTKLAEAFKSCYCCLPELDAARAALHETEARIEFLNERITRLADAETRNIDLEAELHRLKTTIPRIEAEVRAKESDMQSALLAYGVLLSEAESLTGIDANRLKQHLDSNNEPITNEDNQKLATPYWSTVDNIVVRAKSSGVVNQLGITHQGWAEMGDLVVETIDPTMVRFHADTLQTDIALFEDGLPGRIVPPPGGSIDLQDTIDGEIRVGFQAHPDERTVSIYLVPDQLPRWAKPGVTAYLEVFVAGKNEPVLAIPESAVVRDGLERVFFRRSPENPNEVVRVVADLGVSDNRWVEVNNDVQPGDEIVLGGVYPLMLASSSSGEMQKGGHFHADGTFHDSQDH